MYLTQLERGGGSVAPLTLIMVYPGYAPMSLASHSQVDCWAVGVLAYELLVGVAPFHTKDRTGIKMNIASNEPPMFEAWSLSATSKVFIQAALSKVCMYRSEIRHPKLLVT